MSRRILIDGLYNETRVVLCNDNEVNEFIYQNNVKSLKKGNIYLGKIERIEASLQAAFVNYGGGKHGFLPFSEIHPSHYNLPDKEKESLYKMIADMRKGVSDGNTDIEEDKDDLKFSNNIYKLEHLIYNEIYKKYKIQDVLKKEQSILVQIAKEERSTKGATLTTYITMIGRYSIFMPRSNKLGGISRSINDSHEKERLRNFVDDLRIKEKDSAIIIRGNAIFKTKTEIRRDFDHLVRIWENVQEISAKSKAPSFIYEEGDVIKKIIRDTYDSEVDEIIIAGEKAYQDTLNFMQIVLPRHIGKVKEYTEPEPIFLKYGIEKQINQLYINKVPLKSGGYIVIDQAEALIAIDINSGKSIGERNVEDTALRTNLEAVKEITKQLRLRDLSGLIIIDFIDMQNPDNRTCIENAMKAALAEDPARTQFAKLSEFGLMEMTRQRLQNSIYEANFATCHSCGGRGKMRAIPVTASVILRAIQAEAKNGSSIIEVSSNAELILYILNTKRAELQNIEKKNEVSILLSIDAKAGYDGFFIEHKDNPDLKNDEALSSINDYFFINNISSTDKSSQAKEIQGPYLEDNKNEKKERISKGYNQGKSRYKDYNPNQKSSRDLTPRKELEHKEQSGSAYKGREVHYKKSLQQDSEQEHTGQLNLLEADSKPKGLLRDKQKEISKRESKLKAFWRKLRD